MAKRADDIARSAVFSKCGTYRYALRRRWGRQSSRNTLMLIGVNPSVANAEKDDPTMKRCITFAKGWGYDGLVMVNAFGFVSSNPKVMLAAKDPIGPANDRAILFYLEQVKDVAAVWGVNCPEERAEQVRRLINRPMLCLGLTKDGHPKHPVRLSGKTMLEPYWEP